jgi:hypothetical protein
LVLVARVPFVNARKRSSNSMATSSCSSSFTTSCAARSAAISSNTQQACSVLTATTPATRSAIPRSSPSVSHSQMPRPTRTKPSSTIASPTGSRLFRTWEPTGAAIVVMFFHLVGNKPRSAQNARRLVTLTVCTLCPTSAVCLWKQLIRFLWRSRRQGHTPSWPTRPCVQTRVRSHCPLHRHRITALRSKARLKGCHTKMTSLRRPLPALHVTLVDLIHQAQTQHPQRPSDRHRDGLNPTRMQLRLQPPL